MPLGGTFLGAKNLKGKVLKITGEEAQRKKKNAGRGKFINSPERRKGSK